MSEADAAEQLVLGAMLLNRDAVADVVGKLLPADFHWPPNRVVYEALTNLYGRGEPVDAVTVAAELHSRGVLAAVGGAAQLHTLLASVPSAADAGHYADILAQRSGRG